MKKIIFLALILIAIMVSCCGNRAAAQSWVAVYEVQDNHSVVVKYFKTQADCDKHYAVRDSLRAVSYQNARADAAMASYSAQAAWADLTAELQKISQRLDAAEASYNGLRTRLGFSSILFERPNVAKELPDDDQQLIVDNAQLLSAVVQYNRLLEGLLQRTYQLRSVTPLS